MHGNRDFQPRNFDRSPGLDPKIADDIANNRRPSGMKADEEALYDFVRELLDTRQVSDATYKTALERFGENGIMDLIGCAGYYTLVAMVLSVDRTPIPNEGKPPLPVLK